MLAVILLAIAAFAATNVDNLFVLLAFFAEARDAWRPVAVGQYLGSMALVALACVIASLMIHVPRAYVGLVGVMPILIGIGKLLEQIRRNGRGAPVDDIDTTDDASRSDAVPSTRAGYSVWTVATVAIANGSDNLSVYVPLFAARGIGQSTAIVLVFVAMIALWCVFAKWLVSHRLIGKPISRYAHFVLPWLLMVIGVAVIVGNGTLAAFGL